MLRPATGVLALVLGLTAICGPAIATRGVATAPGDGAVAEGTTASPPMPGRPPSAAAVRLAEASLDDRVAEVQRMLTRHGFAPGPVDGKLGLRTRDAIRAYQSLVRAKEAPAAPDATGSLSRAKGPPLPRAKPAGQD